MIREDLIFFKNDFEYQDECLNFMINEIEEAGLLSDKAEFLKAVYKREEEFSTAVGFGVAIPHGMSDAARESFIAFLKTDRPIKWGKEQKEVNLVFLIGVPEHEKNVTHLKYISQISKNLLHDDFRQHLLSSTNVKEAFEYLNVINDGIKGA